MTDSNSPLLENSTNVGSYSSLSDIEMDKGQNLRNTNLRWVALTLWGFASFCSYFCYDIPSSLQPQIQDRLDINEIEFNSLYMAYSLPNILLPLFGGYFVDYTGLRIAITVFFMLILAGQIIFAVGWTLASFPTALAGRFVFGMGAESGLVAQIVLLVRWFRGQEIALAFGVSLSVSRLGSVANNFLEPLMYEATGSVDLGVWVGTILCVCSLVMVLLLNYIDRKADVAEGKEERIQVDEADRVQLRDIKYFPSIFWLIAINCTVVYICVLCFNNIGSSFFQERFGYSSQNAGMILSITYLISALCAPFIGRVVDQIGKRVWFMNLSVSLMFFAHLAYAIIEDCNQCAESTPFLVLLGLGYAIYASIMWSCIPLVVPERTSGTAYGIVTSIQNTGLFLGPLAVGLIYDNSSNGYYWVSMFFAFVAAVGIATGLTIHAMDKMNSGILDKPEIQGKSHEGKSLENKEL